MSYEMKIRLVEQVLKSVDADLRNADESKKQELIQRRSGIFEELRKLKRLDWEEQNERVGFDDER